jgi:predicted HicB family RNase H-like nuclease
MTKEGHHETAIRFPPEVHAALKKAAEERDLSMNYLVNAAVKEFLPRLKSVEESLLTRDLT